VGSLAISSKSLCAVVRELVAGGDQQCRRREDDLRMDSSTAHLCHDVVPTELIAWLLGASANDKPLVSRGMQMESACGEVLVFAAGAPVT
jgi:hypothetical protein